MKVSQKLEKTPGALKINVVHKIILLGADTKNISAHSMKKLLFKIPEDLNTKEWAKVCLGECMRELMAQRTLIVRIILYQGIHSSQPALLILPNN